MTSTINADKIMNSSGDQDSGLDLLVNDQVKIKTANTDRITVTDSAASMGDNFKLKLGTGNDLNIYHDGSNSYIEETGTGDTHVVSNTVRIRADQINLSNNANNLDGLTMDSSGHIKMPKQPAFLVTKNANQNNIAENTNVTVTFETEIFDQNADFASNTFTAPVTGRYQLNATVRLQDLDVDAHYIYLYLVTSNRSYQCIVTLSSYDEDIEYLTLNIPVLADMDASDTAYVTVHLDSSGDIQVDVEQYNTFFSGYLVA